MDINFHGAKNIQVSEIEDIGSNVLIRTIRISNGREELTINIFGDSDVTKTTRGEILNRVRK